MLLLGTSRVSKSRSNRNEKKSPMSEITTYVGKPGSGKTLVLQEIVRKELLNENSVLVIATEKFDLNPLSYGELTIAYNDDIEQVIGGYRD